MAYGVPAKHQGWVSMAGNRLNFNDNNIAEDSFDNSKYKAFKYSSTYFII